jgi:hypothetical protein
VVIQLTDLVSTRTAHAGDTFKIKLAMPIVADGHVVVPAGATGLGQVVDAGRPGFGGKPAKLVLAARKLDFGIRRYGCEAFTWARPGWTPAMRSWRSA